MENVDENINDKPKGNILQNENRTDKDNPNENAVPQTTHKEEQEPKDGQLKQDDESKNASSEPKLDH